MSFWDLLFGRKPASRKIAKDRLQLVLVHDRSGLSPELLGQMRDEIIAVLSKYVEIDREEMDIQLTQGRDQNKLVANIPIRRKRVAPPF
ncbi:MAG: cell division topological specificity factor MinE [Ardenticatenaceae bacterium]